MLNAWTDDIDPARRNTNGDWLTPLLSFQGSGGPPLWAGPQGATNQGEFTLYNPASPQSPYANSGLPGTYKSSDANRNTFGGAAGTPNSSGMASATGAPAGFVETGMAAAPNISSPGLGAAAGAAGGASALTTWMKRLGLDNLDRLGGIGELLGNTASQRAGERNLESLANAANYRTQQDALLKAYQLAMLSQQQLPGQMSRANLMANPPADLKLSHPRAAMPNIQGGIQMSNLTSGASQALGEAMKKTALQQGLKGYDTAGMVMQPPAYLKGNALDTTLNLGGFLGGLANAWKYGTGKT